MILENYQGVFLPKNEVIALRELEKLKGEIIPNVEEIHIEVKGKDVFEKDVTVLRNFFGFSIENGHVIKINLRTSYFDSIKSETIQLIKRDINNGSINNPHNLIKVSSIEVPQQTNFKLSMLAPIMGGMMIFFAFFTGTTSAQTILREAEQGTLSRLFTTPTSKRTILAGKFLAVLLTVWIQVSVLIFASHYLFI